MGDPLRGSMVFFDHKLSDANFGRFILAGLVFIFTMTAGEAIPLGLEFLFKRVLKLQRSFHEISALILLLMNQPGLGITYDDAVDILVKRCFYQRNQINEHGTREAIVKIHENRLDPREFYRTNFFELFYLTVRGLIYFFGFYIAFYLVQIDYIIWLSGFGVSVLVIYSLMSHINNGISHVLLLYTNRIRVGTIVQIPNTNENGCVIQMSIFQIKCVLLNHHLVFVPKKTPKVIKADIAQNTNVDLVPVYTSNNNNDSIGVSNHGGSTTIPFFLPLPVQPIQPPSTQQSKRRSKNKGSKGNNDDDDDDEGSGDEDEIIINIPTHHSHLTQHEDFIKRCQNIMSYGWIPNTVIYQTFYREYRF